jgi:DNA-binding CsgD family transcriptional regulator
MTIFEFRAALLRLLSRLGEMSKHFPMTTRFTNPSFVGRVEELHTLRASFPDAARAAGGFVAIAGEPGIGKTRLMDEIAKLATADGKRVLWGQMIEDSGAPPYLPWTLVLRDYAQQCDDETLRTDIGSAGPDIGLILPDIRDRLGVDARPASTDGSRGRYALFDAVTRLFLTIARRQPLVVLLDNLHSADGSTLALLEYLCGQIAGSPILIVGAYRHVEFDRRNPLRTVIARLARSRGFRKLPLQGLALDEVALLLGTHIRAPVPASLVQAVHDQSGGSPLFVCEVASILARPAASEALSASRYHFRVPESLRDVINARLDGLPAETVDLLGVAAIFGREFQTSLLAELAEVAPEHASRRLEPAEAAGIIAASLPDRFRFHHALFREVLYAEHSTVTRARLHSRAGELIESRYGGDTYGRLTQLAHHFFEAAQADSGEKAASYCRAAATAALSRRAYAEAATLFERTLQVRELHEAPNLETRFELLLETGQAQYQAGALIAATQTLMKAAILAYRQRWWERLANALFVHQLVCQQSGFRHIASIPLHEQALQHLPDDAESLKARCLVSLAKAYRTSGQPERAAGAFRAGLELARRCPDRRVLLDCLRKGNWTIGRTPSSIREGLAISREALELARIHGPADAVLDALVDIVFQLCDLGETEEAERRLTEVSELAREQGQPHFQNVVTGFETAIAILRGNWDRAFGKAQQTLRQVPLQGVLGLEGRYAFQMFSIKKARGELGDVRGLAEQILAKDDGTKFWLPGRILLHCELGQNAQAHEALQRLGDLRELPRDDLYVISLIYLSESCVALRSKQQCSLLYELLSPYRSLNATLPGTLMLGAVSGYLGLLAATTHRFAEARVLYEEAIELNASMGAHPFLARAMVDYGRVLLMDEAPERKSRAIRLITAGRRIAEELELKPVLDAVDELRETSGIEELTKREIDILKVVATGLSNNRIAETFHISHSTVTTHLRNIFRKTGTANRTEAAEFARRAGVLD